MDKNIKAKTRDLKIARLYEDNFSASVIARKLSLSLRQVYRSLINQKVKRRNPQEQSKISFANKPLSFTYRVPKSQTLKFLEVAGLMLYYGEGAKTGSTVDFANSDPRALKIFLAYLRKVCFVDESRIRLYLYCFSNMSTARLIRFWSKELKVKQRAFTLPYVRKAMSNNRDRVRVMKYGVLHIRYSDKKLLGKILADIDQNAKKLIK